MKDESSQGPLRIGLVATDPLRVLGLQTLFPENSPIEIVPLSIPGVLEDKRIPLILIDAGCTEHLFELLTAFRRARPQLKLIVLGLEAEHVYIERIIGAGASGYLLHSANESEIRMAINIIQDGSIWAPRKVLARLLQSSANESLRKALPAPKFTGREQEVLRLLVAGHPNRAIADEMGIDLITVKAHVGRLMRKVGVENRIELSVKAVNRDLIREGRGMTNNRR